MSLPFIQANTNGRLHPAHEPSITPLNRGFLYGDAIYEVWRTYGGVVFAWDEHFERLRASARALYLQIPFAAEEMFSEIARTVRAFRLATGFSDDVYIRLQLARGSGAIGLDIELAERAEYTLLVQPCPRTPEKKFEAGLRLAIATGLRRNPAESLNPAWKTGNYLNNLLGLREARARGADDVVMLNLAGEVTEAATSNIGFVRGGEIVTPPLNAGILAGITRQLIVDRVAARAGLRIREEVVRPSDLARMDECFLLSSTKDVTPVSVIDETRFKVGSDTLTLRLKGAFADYVRDYAAAHPQQKV